MTDNRIIYSFKYGHDDGVSIATEHNAYDVTYHEVAENFFKFLSIAFGYEITAKDVINEDSCNTRLPD